jgi:VIT1/CCC1 family predicted Fe2+/Mn2+ transporter
MKMEKLTENLKEAKMTSFPKEQRNKLIIIIGIMILVNYVLSSFQTSSSAVHLDGTIASSDEVRQATIKTLLISINILGFIIGSLLNFIPFKGLSYSKRYLRTSLLTIIGIHMLFFLLGSLSLIFK